MSDKILTSPNPPTQIQEELEKFAREQKLDLSQVWFELLAVRTLVGEDSSAEKTGAGASGDKAGASGGAVEKSSEARAYRPITQEELEGLEEEANVHLLIKQEYDLKPIARAKCEGFELQITPHEVALLLEGCEEGKNSKGSSADSSVAGASKGGAGESERGENARGEKERSTEDLAILVSDIIAMLAYHGVFIKDLETLKTSLHSQLESAQATPAQMDKASKKDLAKTRLVIHRPARYIPSSAGYCEFVLKEEWERSGQKIQCVGGLCEILHDEESPTLAHAHFAVNKEELIARYHKPRMGQSGRNIYGEFVRVQDAPPPLPLPQFNPQEVRLEEVRLEESGEAGESCSEFYALIDAFVRVGEDSIVFFTQREFESVEALAVPPLLGGIERDIALKISTPDPTKDAISSGVILEATSITIHGNVGANVFLRAKELIVQGQTHQSAELHALQASITTHKGYLAANNAQIKNLETGTIESQILNIEKSLGGNIFAQNLTIKTLSGNNKITLSSQLHVESIEGNDNVLTLSANACCETKAKMQALESKREMIVRGAQKTYARYLQTAKLMQKNSVLIAQINRAPESIKKQMMTNRSIVAICQRQERISKELEALKVALADSQLAVRGVLEELVALDEVILEAKLCCDDAWGENTQLVYQRHYPQKESKSLVVSSQYKGDYKMDKATQEFIEARRD